MSDVQKVVYLGLCMHFNLCVCVHTRVCMCVCVCALAQPRLLLMCIAYVCHCPLLMSMDATTLL